MKYFDWDDEKNRLLKDVRGVSFEEVVLAIENGDLLDRLKHPNSAKYPNQMVFYVSINGYVYAVPFVEDDEKIFLKSIIPDRKANKKYLGGTGDE
ncbi:MAG: BrnT family toxin [Nitrospirae bacterium]|nr:BrnT family toxin [Nitrospirota bacterium]